MVGLELSARRGDREHVRRRVGPRQIGEPLEIVDECRELGVHRRHAPEALELARRHLVGLRWQVGRAQLALELGHLTILIVAAAHTPSKAARQKGQPAAGREAREGRRAVDAEVDWRRGGAARRERVVAAARGIRCVGCAKGI